MGRAVVGRGVLVLCLCALGYGVGEASSTGARMSAAAPQNPASAFHVDTCDASLWNHVYHGIFPTAKDRLKVFDPCIAVTGTIEVARPEADGDRHILLRVDPQFSKLLNAKNMTAEKGFLVIEPVCELKVTQPDTIKEGVCKSFHQNLYAAKLHGKHVSVIGAYIEDQEHGWRELHPVTSITPN